MKKLLLIILFFVTVFSFGQEKVFNGNPDTAFEVARKLAFNKKRAQAQDSLILILTKYPDYHDIRSFLGSTYTWDGDYKKARKAFSYILAKSPKRLDTWEAAIKNELWSNATTDALLMANESLKHFPNNPDLLYLKASAEDKLNKPEEALKTLEMSLLTNEDHEKTKAYQTSLTNKLSLNTIGLKAAVDLYSEVFDPMQYYLIKYARATKYGSIHAKVNINRRFQSNGVQFEVDMYPRISNGLYAYLNFGVANSFLFPDIRYGAELYKSLPKGLEASLGFRALKFSSTTNIYTGSVGWYTKNNYWSFRGYVTPGEPKASMSGTLSFRKYRSDANNYFSISGGAGFSPEENRFNFGGNENTIINLQSQKLNFGYYFSSKNKSNLWGAQAGISHQEISFNPGSYFWIYSFSLSWDLLFK